MIDWPHLLTQHRIEFRETKRDLYVKCPFCGNADEGMHLGVSTVGKGWGCWRNTHHRGKSPVRLLAALLNVSWERAASILANTSGHNLVDDNDLSGKLKVMLEKNVGSGVKNGCVQNYTELRFTPDIKPLNVTKTSQRMFHAYMLERGYKPLRLEAVCRQYKLHCATSGMFTYRVIFPVYTELGLTTWTGRSIVPGRQPRYLTLTSDPDVAGPNRPCGLSNIKDCLFNERWLFAQSGGKALIVSEGPFDAMRLDYAGRTMGIHATGLFGKVASEIQLQKLADLSERYDYAFTLLDPDAEMDRFAFWNRLPNFKPIKQPGTWEDPGAMPIKAIKQMYAGLV